MSYDNFPTLEDVDLSGKRVLLRISADVPLTCEADGVIEVADDTRLRAVIPTFKALLEKQCSIVCCGGWLGRPTGAIIPELRMDPVAKCMSELLEIPVQKLDDCVGRDVEQAVSQLKPGEIVLLENTRFHPEEAANSSEFASTLASFGEVCVFDAFSQSHRNHASTTGIVRLLPTVLGPQMVHELTELKLVTENPEHPFVAVLGGAKITDKIGMLLTLVDKADIVLIGGAIASAFLKSREVMVGSSKINSDDIDKTGADSIELAKEISGRAGNKLILPIDLIAGDSPTSPTRTTIVEMKGAKIKPDMEFNDIGPKTVELFEPIISSAKTIFWNGPMGRNETPVFSSGTVGIASAIAKNKSAVTIVGGGDSAKAVRELNLTDQFTHVSTGGGASLVVVSGRELAVLNAIKEGTRRTAS